MSPILQIMLLESLVALNYKWYCNVDYDLNNDETSLEITLVPWSRMPALTWGQDANIAFLICLKQFDWRGILRSPALSWLKVPVTRQQANKLRRIQGCSLETALFHIKENPDESASY